MLTFYLQAFKNYDWKKRPLVGLTRINFISYFSYGKFRYNIETFCLKSNLTFAQLQFYHAVLFDSTSLFPSFLQSLYWEKADYSSCQFLLITKCVEVPQLWLVCIVQKFSTLLFDSQKPLSCSSHHSADPFFHFISLVPVSCSTPLTGSAQCECVISQLGFVFSILLMINAKHALCFWQVGVKANQWETRSCDPVFYETVGQKQQQTLET